MRPLDMGKGLGYVPAKTMSWNKTYRNKTTTAWEALNAITGKTEDPLVLNTDYALQLALDLETGHATLADGITPVPDPTKKNAKAAIMDKASDIYPKAGIFLAAAIGPFCAYCETQLPGLIEVDHVANKSQFPTYTTEWKNFLPACGPCNNTKRDNPDRAAAAVLKPNPPLNPNDNKDLPFYEKIRDEQNYRWPDTNGTTFNFFEILFQAWIGGGWKTMFYSDAANLDYNYLVKADFNTGEVRANLIYRDQLFQQGTVHPNVATRVLVAPDGANLTELCGLNAAGTMQKTEGNATYNRRLYNRTLAWFKALNIMRPLRDAQSFQDVNDLWPLIQTGSGSVGFWSVWLSLLSQYDDRNTPPKSLGYWFCVENNDEYPGTNLSQIQLPARQ